MISLIKHLTVQEVNYQKLIANGIYNRSKALMTYIPAYNKLKSNVTLIKPTQSSVTDLPDDYALSEYFEKPIKVHTFEGNHVTILENQATAELINSYLQENTGSA